MVGPLLCKYAMLKSGEAGKALTTEENAALEVENDPATLHMADLNKAAIIGVTPMSKSIALALLKKQWGVILLARSPEEATHFRGEVSEWAVILRFPPSLHSMPACRSWHAQLHVLTAAVLSKSVEALTG